MLGEPQAPLWSIDGRDWPNREHSRFLTSGGLTWHVQEMGQGPALLLLHGTGAATHSFRDLAPMLARHFRVLMLDLPGHGFTGRPARAGLSLDGMARLVAGVLARIDCEPKLVVGHSAGAAILATMALQGTIQPAAVIAINGALRPIPGAALFSPLAKLLFLNPLAPRFFAHRARSRAATAKLLADTGSRLDARGIDLYARLFRRPGHVAGTLGMMAQWDLSGLERRLARLSLPLVLITAAGDRAVPPADAEILAQQGPMVRAIALAQGGHLAHEEDPAGMATLLLQLAGEFGILAGNEPASTPQGDAGDALPAGKRAAANAASA
ncbi:alpha/beta fold hydrolase BchO [Aureimonas glaciei]|uniref:Alpha/beta hydrolase n=1 Tax=Aureimonas glaciei TaxID=1776957 RepID=A0A917DA99_9HYPH|nr:alpha/beta fold hydrolase BchO [Aureimonas glaciei]GGD17159.1 alpha/beta hydrolase [Aureimonas glaciei]